LSYRLPILAATCALLFATPAQATVSETGDAAVLANSALRSPDTLAGASWDASASPEASAVATDELQGFPVHGSDYLILSTGDTRVIPGPDQSVHSSGFTSGGTRGGAGDVVALRLDLNVPAGANCLTLTFRYLSEEWPGFVGQGYNDGFLAELDPSEPWTMTNHQITAPSNFAFMPGGAFVSINSADMTSEAGAGTVLNGGTELLEAATPVTPGTHALVLSVWDDGDLGYDSAAFVDYIRVFTAGPEGCVAGASEADVTPPDTAIGSTPDPISGDTATFAFTSDEADSTFECRVDEGQWSPCSSPHNLTGLSSGSHTFEVRATDASGNTDPEPATYTWTADTTPPDTVVTSGPSEYSSSAAASFGFAADDAEASFECRLDGTDWASCSSPQAYGPVGDGPHTFSVRAIDALGNTDTTPASRSWTVDTSAPAAPEIVAGPSGSTAELLARFALAGEPGATIECRVDGGPWAVCSDSFDLDGLPPGHHVLEVRQVDAAGNVSAVVERAWEIVLDASTDGVARVFTASVGSRVRPSGRRVAVADGGRVPVGCALDLGAMRRCTVRAWAGGKLVGEGSARYASGVRSGRVTVKLSARMRARLRNTTRMPRTTFVFRADVVGRNQPMTARRKAFLAPRRQWILPSDGLFESGRARLVRGVRSYLRAIARELESVRTVECVGHTDSIGTRAANERLGLRRARAVCAYIRRLGVPGRLLPSSRGETSPRASNRTWTGRWSNRRVELRILR
jgi:outer membrane protein OmpA-like peptidoglycan-associated protein